MSLDIVLSRNLLSFSVSEIISELFYGNRNFRNASQNGDTYHFKLGFMNAERYCSFIKLDFAGYPGRYIKLCGIPDRITCKESVCFVEELKTTYSNRLEFAKKVGYAQLQLYMLITGIEKGKLYIYLKDKNEIQTYEFGYNPEYANLLLLNFLEIVSRRAEL